MRTDPEQLEVNQEVRERLLQLHHASLNEYKEEDGPLVWLLAFPTTHALAISFAEGRINEQQLFEQTPLDVPYQAIYLCSALALPEVRGKGIVKRIALEAIKSMQQDHPIAELLVWPFTPAGDALAEKLGAMTGLPLLKRSATPKNNH